MERAVSLVVDVTAQKYIARVVRAHIIVIDHASYRTMDILKHKIAKESKK